jgi:hypothetical protein
LKTGILIPVDSHIDRFADHKRISDDASLRLQRSDLVHASVRDGKLVFHLIEVKYRSGAGGAGEDAILKEAIADKNENTQKVLQARFLPRDEKDRLDRELQNKELANLLRLYMDRSRRHGLLEGNAADSEEMLEAIANVGEGKFDIVFEKAGFIYHTAGLSKPVDTYKGNEVFVVGSTIAGSCSGCSKKGSPQWLPRFSSEPLCFLPPIQRAANFAHAELGSRPKGCKRVPIEREEIFEPCLCLNGVKQRSMSGWLQRNYSWKSVPMCRSGRQTLGQRRNGTRCLARRETVREEARHYPTGAS